MNLSDWSSLIHHAWQTHPDGLRVALALLAYMLVVSLMSTAAALISSEMPFFESMPSI